MSQGRGVLNNRPAANGPTPRTRDGKPDLSGVWNPDRTSALKPGESLPLQPCNENNQDVAHIVGKDNRK